MVDTIVVALFIPICSFITGYFSIKSFKIGVEISQLNKKIDELEKSKEVNPVISEEDKEKSKKALKEYNELMREWTEGVTVDE